MVNHPVGRSRSIAITALLVLVSSLMAAGPANAAVPANDEAGSAVVVTDVSFTNAQNTAEATSGPEDSCGMATVWYTFTPSVTGAYLVDTFGSDYDTTLAAYAGAPGGNFLNCVDDTRDLQAGMVLTLTAGTPYYFEAGTCCGVGEPGQEHHGGNLIFNISAYEPLTVEVSIDDYLLLSSVPGIATVSGTVTCSGTAEYGYVEVEWRQRQGRELIRGSGATGVNCSTTPTPWTITLDAERRAFNGSRVYVTTYAVFCGDLSCSSSDRISRQLRPRRQ